MGRKARVARPATRYNWRMPDTPGPSTTPGLTPAPTPTITPKPNGPLVVVGLVRIVTPDGRELPVPPRKDGRPAEVVVLCRCGVLRRSRFVTERTSGTGSAIPPR